MPTGVYPRTEEHKAKIRTSCKISQNRPDVKEKISKACKNPSAETRRKRSLASKRNWEKLKADPERLAKRNKKLSEALKGKYTGSKSSNWRGGKWDKTRLSNEAKEWRKAVLARDDYTCRICNVRGGELHVDHINRWSDYPELRFELSNGRALCRPCHYYVTFKKTLSPTSGWGKRKLKLINQDV